MIKITLLCNMRTVIRILNRPQANISACGVLRSTQETWVGGALGLLFFFLCTADKYLSLSWFYQSVSDNYQFSNRLTLTSNAPPTVMATVRQTPKDDKLGRLDLLISKFYPVPSDEKFNFDHLLIFLQQLSFSQYLLILSVFESV